VLEGGEDVAEVIMRRSAVKEWPEAAQKFAFLAAEPRDLDEGIGSRQDRQEGQKQYFIEWIHHLAALARVWHIFEMIEKYDRLRKRSAVCRRVVHDRSPPCESRGPS
jgi:hypothetical protein